MNATTTMDRRYIHLQISAQRAAIGDPHDGKNNIDRNRIIIVILLSAKEDRAGRRATSHGKKFDCCVAPTHHHTRYNDGHRAPSTPPRVNAQFIANCKSLSPLYIVIK